MFKNEPLVLALTAPITSSDSAGVVVPTPKLVPNEPDETIDKLSNPNISPALPLILPLELICPISKISFPSISKSCVAVWLPISSPPATALAIDADTSVMLGNVNLPVTPKLSVMSTFKKEPL